MVLNIARFSQGRSDFGMRYTIINKPGKADKLHSAEIADLIKLPIKQIDIYGKISLAYHLSSQGAVA